MTMTTDQTTALYDAIDAFQRTHRLPGLQHAQIRGLLAEHLARALPAAVPVPPPVDRAAKAEALLLHFTAEAHRRKWSYDRGLDDDGVPIKSEAFDALHRLGDEMNAELHKLRRRAAEEQPAETHIVDHDDTEPTQLRWGLNDVMWGDDDSVTVLLSGPQGEPYWLELGPERAAVLREDLAGPDGDRPAVVEQPDTQTREAGQ